MPYGYGMTIKYRYKAFLHKAIELSKPGNRGKKKKQLSNGNQTGFRVQRPYICGILL